MLRELVRQALLLAARESLGLATRDATLREVIPDDLPAANRLHVTARFQVNAPARFVIERRAESARMPLLQAEGEAWRARPDDVLTVLQRAEILSRTDFVNALAAAGFGGQPRPARPDLAVPRETEALLGDMTFTAQYQAVRELHALMRSRGESQAVVGALARAYAHLGVQTECHWGPANKVYRARSLLYSQRLIAADAQSPWGYWHRAYAAALAGMHKTALDDLARAAEVIRKGGGTRTEAPPWLSLIEPLCRFDTARLKDACRENGLAQLASLLNFLAVESRTSVHATLEAAKQALQNSPECFRIHDSISDIGGVSTRHVTTVAGMELFSQTFPVRLNAMPELPASVARLLQAGAAERELIPSLVATGRSSADMSEPSWAILGRWAQDARFLQVCRRLYFMKRLWSVPVDDFLVEARPLIADHPLAAYAEGFGIDGVRSRDEYARLLAGLPLADVDYRADALFRALSAADPKGYQERLLGNTAQQYMDYLHYDYVMMISMNQPQNRPPRARTMLLYISPHSPAPRATLINDDWDSVKQHAEAWEKESAHPDVLLALGRRYATLKQTDDAERCLKKCIALSPGREATRALAEAYKVAGKTEQWLATMEGFLQGEDVGLEHAQVRVELARHFMQQKDFKRALPYAEDAAETWAVWAMRCASECHEGLGNWDKAELWVRRVSERYDESCQSWFFWCKRTGRGDARSAQILLEQQLSLLGEPRTLEDFARLTGYFYLTGQPKKALDVASQVSKDQRAEWSYLFAVAVFDELNERAQRDKALQALPAASPYRPLADLLAATFAKGEKAPLDPAAIDKLVKDMTNAQRGPCLYAVGSLMQRRGQGKPAADCFKRVQEEAGQVGNVFATLAGARLNAARPK